MRGPFATHASGHTPAIEQLLEDAAPRRARPLGRRERRAELAVGAAFLAAAVPMAILLPGQRPFSLGVALVLTAAYAIASRVEFDFGAGYSVPTQLVFVPMLFALPIGAVPLFAAAGFCLGKLPDYLTGHKHPDRALLALGDSWHAIPPALILALAGAGSPDWGQWPIYVLALGGQFAFDFAGATARDWLSLGIPPHLQFSVLGEVYVVDAMLAPIGLLAAFAAVDQPYAFLAALPLAGLMAIFARERGARIRNALELSRAYRGTALLLGDVLEGSDAYTADHSRSVVSLAVQVADRIGLDSRERRLVEFGALLHDIGKLDVPDAIINKPGRLSEAEWEVMRTHTIAGQRMLDRVGGMLADVGRIVYASHERWDGDGYPQGLAGEEIPLAARIIACCDAFNAMTTNRSYRKAMSVGDALTELRTHSGSQFDPVVVGILLQAIGAPGPAPRPVAAGRNEPHTVAA